MMIANKNHNNQYRFLECRPDCYSTWYEQANQLREQHFFSEALFCYDKALEYYKHDYYSWYYRGKVLEELDLFDEALSNWVKACEIQPNNYWAWYDRGCLLQSRLNDHALAIICFDHALKYKQEDYWATYRLAKSYFKIKKYLSALYLWQKALIIRPDDYWSYYWQGECQQILKQWFNAEKSYLQALAIKPRDYWATYRLAVMKQRQCLYREAIEYYHQLQDIAQEIPEIYQGLITCYGILGHHQQADDLEKELLMLNESIKMDRNL